MDKRVQMRSFRNRMFDCDHTRIKEQRILVPKIGLASVKFHIENDEEQAALDSLQPARSFCSIVMQTTSMTNRRSPYILRKRTCWVTFPV